MLRKEYFAHFRFEEDKVRAIWASAFFAFDANTVLNLYRYSDATRSEFINVLEELKGRVWLPEQAIREFFNNRLSVISSQIKTYDTTEKMISTLKDDLGKNRGHPHIETKTMSSLSKVLESVERDLSENRDKHIQRITNDDILENIASVFEDRIGPEYTADELETLLTSGDLRLTAKVPPGYKDYDKQKSPATEDERRANYGDLIIWMQTMDFAKAEGKPIVLVTDDAKEDWWLLAHGKTVGPRPELVKEFFEVTQQHILLYSSEQFLRHAKEHLESTVSKETLDEVKESGAHDKSKRESDPPYSLGLPNTPVSEASFEQFKAYLENRSKDEKNMQRFISSKIGEDGRAYNDEYVTKWRREEFITKLHAAEVELQKIRARQAECDVSLMAAKEAIEGSWTTQRKNDINFLSMQRDSLRVKEKETLQLIKNISVLLDGS